MIKAGEPLAELRFGIVGLIQRQGSESFDTELAETIERWILREPEGAQAGGSGESPASSEGTRSLGNGSGSGRASRDVSSSNIPKHR